MGPIWVLSAPDGPHVGPIDLAIRVCISFGICLTLEVWRDFKRFWWPFWILNDIIWSVKMYSKYLIATEMSTEIWPTLQLYLFADGLVPSGIRTSVGTMMTKFPSRINTGLALEGLKPTYVYLSLTKWALSNVSAFTLSIKYVCFIGAMVCCSWTIWTVKYECKRLFPRYNEALYELILYSYTSVVTCTTFRWNFAGGSFKLNLLPIFAFSLIFPLKVAPKVPFGSKLAFTEPMVIWCSLIRLCVDKYEK